MEKENKEKEGFHKGALTTLINERNELARIITIVDSLIKAHAKALKELGIDIEAEMRKAQEAATKKQKLEEKAE